MSVSIKNFVSKIPYHIGKYLTHVPYNLRFGKIYTEYRKLIEDSFRWSSDQKIEFLVGSLNHIKNHAQNNYGFYKELYQKYDVINLEIEDLSDWSKLPLIEKEQLRNNLSSFRGHQKINTGGTSGEPFAFYIDKFAWAREWAHMHFIWELKGYDYRLPKLTLRGKNLGERVYQFNPVHNEFVINTYLSFYVRENALKIKDLISRLDIRFVHGYPSAVFNFFSELEKVLTADEKTSIQKHLKICFFGSEYPMHYMMEYLEGSWGLDFISWYGHSEMCILGFDENKNNIYTPFITYGYAELQGKELIGTSFNNVDMPLLRYHTGDLVDGHQENGLLTHFSIKEGRSGDFVKDKKGKNIPLTALIFGRHHKAFDVFDFIQVRQDLPGSITILATNKDHKEIREINHLFDFSNVDIDVKYEVLDAPFLTKAGKLKLKV